MGGTSRTMKLETVVLFWCPLKQPKTGSPSEVNMYQPTGLLRDVRKNTKSPWVRQLNDWFPFTSGYPGPSKDSPRGSVLLPVIPFE